VNDTIERLHSCIAESRELMFRLTYEVSDVPELNDWRHLPIRKEEISVLSLLTGERQILR